jgi:hypothetical protein
VVAHRTKDDLWVVSIATLHLHPAGRFGDVFASDERWSEEEVGSVAFGGMPQNVRRIERGWFTYRVG